MEQILLTSYFLKEIVTAMMLYRSTSAKVRSPDGDTDFFDSIAGILQLDTLTPHLLILFIICLDYVLPTSIDLIKENGFQLKER